MKPITVQVPDTFSSLSLHPDALWVALNIHNLLESDATQLTIEVVIHKGKVDGYAARKFNPNPRLKD